MRCTGGVFSYRAPQCLVVAHKSVDRVRDAGLGRHPLLKQGLESLHIELSQQQAEGGKSDGGLAMWVPSRSLRVLRCRLA